MISLSPVDYAAVLCYLLAIAVFGSSFYRKNSTAREYFLGGRSMGWLPAGISIVAADLSAITIMGQPAWSFKHNLEIFWLALGYPLMAPVAILVFVPFYSKLNLYTAYEYLERRFDLRARLVVSALFQMLRAWHVAVAIFGPALVIHLVTDLPVWKCILAMGFFTSIYTALGGIKAVIWTDVIQFVTVTTGVTLILLTAIHRVPGGAVAAFHIAQHAGRLRLINLSTDPSQLTSLWACLAGGFVLALAPLTTDQAILQRLFTTKSTRDCRQSVIVQSVLVIPIAVLLYALGLALFAFYQVHPDRLRGIGNLDAIVPFFAVKELPVGVAGLVIAAIFAASMAVMSAGINSLTTATTVDFYQRVFRPGRAAQHYARVGRFGTAAWGVVVTLLALLAGKAGDLMVAYSHVSSMLVGPMLGIFLLATLTKRANTPGVLAGAFAAAATVAAIIVFSDWGFFLYGPIGVLVTLFFGYAASLLAPPPRHRQIAGLVLGSGEIRDEAAAANPATF